MDPVDETWNKRPELIRQYYEYLPRHERLCEEVGYIVQAALREANIETAHITSRAKSLKSFCEKVQRKAYEDSIDKVSDLAGVRIVFLYISDIENIQTIIEKEFDVIEKQNKLDTNDSDKFGYGALHYLVNIKKKHTGARYDDLKSLVCEIQVRTILQDAWSIVAHHLSYKQEEDVPKALLRKLNALSGLFETADDQFERLREARSLYIEKFEKNLVSSTKSSLSQQINLDNLIAFLTTRFPDRKRTDTESYAELLEELKHYGYLKLSQLDQAIERGISAALIEEESHPPISLEDDEVEYLDVGIVRTVLSIVDEGYCRDKYSDELWDRVKEYKLGG